jgi:hypothetical protein
MSELEFSYDEVEAVKFIQNYLPQEMKGRFTDDNIYYILDLICEFYEENDCLDNDDEEQEEKELIQFVIKEAGENGVFKFSTEEIRLVLRAEEAYYETLDIPE